MGRRSVAMLWFRWVLLWLVAFAIVADGHSHSTHYVHARSQSQEVVLEDWGKKNESPLSNGRHEKGGLTFTRRIAPPALRLYELRGGASKQRSSQQTKKMANSEYYYGELARALMPRLSKSSDTQGAVVKEKVSQALERLSKSQQALKGLDGAAHEAYQRTKAPSSVDSTSVAGRAARSAARTGCTADALLAAELCDLFSLVISSSSIHDDDPTQTTHTTANHPFNFSTHTITTTTHTESNEEKDNNDDHTLTGRHIVLNITHVNVTYYDTKEKNRLALPMSVLVVWEPEYVGGAGLDHGGVDGLLLVSSTTTTTTPTSLQSRVPKPRGRLLVLIQDGYANDLERTMACLDLEPQVVALNVGLVANEASSVNGLLFKAAGQVLQTILPTLQTTLQHQTENTTTTNNNDDDQESLPAIHFVGQSLAGGVASLAATILDGSLSMPQSSSSSSASSSSKKKRRGSQSSSRKRKGRKRGVVIKKEATTTKDDQEEKKEDECKESLTNNNSTGTAMLGRSDLSGHGRGRTSALVLGAPPCLSGNVKAAFVTSIIYGDDIICRTTRKSLDRLCQRTEKAMHGGLLGKQVGWMSDAVSLTVSSLKSHAHGSEGEEERLTVPGTVYLIRPRRLGGASSMHEVGGSKGGREALRAAVLWQLHDVLLSPSHWTHHGLHSYIHGLDRVQLKGVSSTTD